MSDELPFDRLVRALRDGDDATWGRVFDEVLPRVRAALREEFGSGVARSENAGGQALASACRTLYHNLAEGRFLLGSWDDLAGLLIRIASNKCVDRLKKDRRLVSWTDLGDSSGGPATPTGRHPVAGGRSPEAEAVRAEAHQAFRRAVDLVRRRLRRADRSGRGASAEIFRLRLEGTYSNAEIAAMVGRSERTVERSWADAVDMLRGMMDGSAAEDLID